MKSFSNDIPTPDKFVTHEDHEKCKQELIATISTMRKRLMILMIVHAVLTSSLAAIVALN